MGAADRSDQPENHLDDAEWVSAASTLTFLSALLAAVFILEGISYTHMITFIH